MARMFLNHSARGSIHMRKTIKEARELIETFATNQHLYSAAKTSMKEEVKAISTEHNPLEPNGPLTQQLHALVQQLLALEIKDFGSFMIPCTLGDACTRTALCDPGASINLLPALLLIEKLCLTNKVKPTRICLQLADGSIKIPSGIIEDMIVRVGPFAFPIDFVVLDMEGHKSASLILGRPFLVIGRTLIDVKKREVTLRVNEEKFILNTVKAMQHPDTLEECMNIDLIDSLVEEVSMVESLKEGLNDILTDAQLDLEELPKSLRKKRNLQSLSLSHYHPPLNMHFWEMEILIR
ncbi:uncharacterized protein LOC107489428 [Arachis duranensis]|uniref:Uncharacterized protein LOC107489428 n=1 Tax=Arachis duranensis TaxID=130453 RepID=A0A6P4DGD5_ARADU|nr:uncharacterized protein LOC107489428 [Arachis duranensis]